MAISVLLVFGCNEEIDTNAEPTVNSSISFDYDLAYFRGELRVGILSDDASNIDSDTIPSVALPIISSTTGRISVTDVSMPDGLSMEAIYNVQAVVDGTVAEFCLPILGTPTTAGEATLEFKVDVNGKEQELSIPVYILGADENVNNLVVSSIAPTFTICQDVRIREDLDTCLVELTYSEGWARKVKFVVTSPEGLEIDGDGIYTLAGGTTERSMYLPIKGTYPGTDASVNLEIAAYNADGSALLDSLSVAYDASASVTETTYAPADLVYDFSANFFLKEAQPIRGEGNLEFIYENGEDRVVEMSLQFDGDVTGVDAVFENPYTLNRGSGSIEIPLEGIPSGSGTVIFTFQVQGDAIDEVGGEGTDVFEQYVTAYVDPIMVTNISFSGPIVNGNKSSKFQLIVDYTGGADGYELALDYLTGDVAATTETLKLVDTVKLSGNGDGQAIFNLGINDILTECTFDSDDVLLANKSISVGLTYDLNELNDNSVGSLPSAKANITFQNAGFRWYFDGKYYGTVQVGDRVWLDRNIGADHNIVTPVETVKTTKTYNTQTDSVYISAWADFKHYDSDSYRTHNGVKTYGSDVWTEEEKGYEYFRAYGDVYQRCRDMGIPTHFGEDDCDKYPVQWTDTRVPFYPSVSYRQGDQTTNNWYTKWLWAIPQMASETPTAMSTSANLLYMTQEWRVLVDGTIGYGYDNSVLTSNWGITKSEGNACPDGYRVPYSADVIAMLNEILGINMSDAEYRGDFIETGSQSRDWTRMVPDETVMPALMASELAFTLNGTVSLSGPTQRHEYGSGAGQYNMPGFHVPLKATGTMYGTEPGVDFPNEVVNFDKGNIVIFTSDVAYKSSVAATGAAPNYLQFWRIDEQGQIYSDFLSRYTSSSMRCIENKGTSDYVLISDY